MSLPFAVRRILSVLPCLCLLFAMMSSTGAQAEDLLPPDQAFRMTAERIDAQTAEVRFEIAPGYYLYRNKFKFASAPGKPIEAAASFPEGDLHEDNFFGKQTVYHRNVVIRIPAADIAQIIVTAQGCSEKFAVCYPPTEFSSALKQATMSRAAPEARGNGLLPGLTRNTPEQMDKPGEASAAGERMPDSITTVDDSDDSFTQRLLENSSLPVVLFSFFGLGLLLAFTPCMLPVIPILSSIIVAHGGGLTRKRGFVLTLAYVLGMSLTYALLGVAAGLSGASLAAAFQNIWVLGSFALIFVALSLAMFGVYELQLPSALQSRLSNLANQQRGSILAIGVMGALSALIVGPCMAAPVAGALLYIAQTGNATLGGLALFTLSLGMGVPLLLIGTVALPKAGPWMEAVKKLFGVILLGTALWLLSPVLSLLVRNLLAAALIALAATLVWRGTRTGKNGTAARLTRYALVVLAAFAIGALLSDAVRKPVGANAATLMFENVRSVEELDARLQRTTQPVMLDFYADWCVSCREMEHYTLEDPAIRERLSRITLLRADVTNNTADDKALLKRFGLFGPPGIIFFDAHGNSISGARVIGYQTAERFGKTLDKVQR